MNVPGFRSFVAKRPDCPQAGWEGEVMGVILTRGEGPLGVFGGIVRDSGERVRRVLRWVGVSVGE